MFTINAENMLQIIQILSIVQGIFLAYILYLRRREFVPHTFWLFLGSILSVTLYSIGDDDYNLFVHDAEWFLLKEPLFITFLFLFIRHIVSETKGFNKSEYLFFIPYLSYVSFKILSRFSFSIFQILSDITEFAYIIMLCYSVFEILKHKKYKWILIFIVPFTCIYIIDEATELFSFQEILFFGLDSYGVFLIAIVLFYYVFYRLLVSPKNIVPLIDNKYKTSNLVDSEIESIKKDLKRIMEDEKLYVNQKLTVNEVAQKLGISRQRLSEILNAHLNMRFQDLLNQYRVEAFINCLNKKEFEHYTLFGIATEVGFSSKSSFNAIFKKVKGLTPSGYKKLYIKESN